MERVQWGYLVSHSHWITFDLKGKKVKICARCSGTVLGFIVSFGLLTLVKIPTSLLVVYMGFFLCLPAIIDWLTHNWKLRESANRLRFSTGLMVGTGVMLFSLIRLPLIIKSSIFLIVLTYVFALGYIGKWIKAM